MHDAADHFACSACGKRYRLTPERAGRTVRCGCGHVMICPRPPPPETDDLYDIAPAVAVPAPAAPAPAAPAPALSSVRTRSGAVSAPSIPLAYQSGRDAGDAAMDQHFPDRTIDFHLPLALVAGGTVVEFIAALLRGGS